MGTLKTIAGRKEVSLLVNTFYAKIRKNELLGPIFNGHIPDEKWPEHLSKLTDFWETNLFGIVKFKGNPTQKHLNVDRNLNHTVSQEHFGRWLQIWFVTIESNFCGVLANKAKEGARRMANGQFMAIFNHR